VASPRYERSEHLVGLLVEVERLAEILRAGDPGARQRLAADRRDPAIRANLVLDGASASTLPSLRAAQELLAARTGNDAAAATPRPVAVPGGWLDTLRVSDGAEGPADADDPADAEDATLRALEVVGVARALAADDLADALVEDLPSGLAVLHDRLTRGLVDTDRIGIPRTSEQAVHDGSVGRMLYATTAPAAIPDQLARLGSWLSAVADREHALIVSGSVHLELLRIQPYDAANGRLARTTARLLLRARGFDPEGVVAPEPFLAIDPLGYHQEVAGTLRRRHLTIWLERWGEAVSDALRWAARDLSLLDVSVPARAARFVADRDEPDFTIADYRAQAPAPPEAASRDLAALLDAGRIRRRPGSRGLRFEVVAP
jgi:Fic family protein